METLLVYLVCGFFLVLAFAEAGLMLFTYGILAAAAVVNAGRRIARFFAP